MKKMFNKFIVALVLFAMTSVVFGTALTEERNTPRYDTDKANYTIASNVIIYVGALVAVNANGLLVPAADTAGLNVIGRAEKTVDNSSASYEATANVDVLRGIFRYANGGSFSNANVGDYAYVLDDQTVFTGAMATNDIIAGVIVAVDSSGVWIDTRTIAGQGAISVASLNVSGASTLTGDATLSAGLTVSSNVTITGTLGVTGVGTFTAESVHNAGIDADYITVDAAAGIDTKTAGALKVGESTATSVEIADAGVNTDIQGTLSVGSTITSPAGFANAATTNIVFYTVAAGTAASITNTFCFTNGITRQIN